MFTKPTLVEGEKITYRRGANLVVRLDEAGLDRFAADQLMGLVGMSGQEAVGGHLTITNYRIVFTAHKLNRLKGEFSIPLTQITLAERKAKFPVYKLLVHTENGTFEFVNWYAKAAIEAIEAHEQVDPTLLTPALATELTHNKTLNSLNSLFAKL